MPLKFVLSILMFFVTNSAFAQDIPGEGTVYSVEVELASDMQAGESLDLGALIAPYATWGRIPYITVTGESEVDARLDVTLVGRRSASGILKAGEQKANLWVPIDGASVYVSGDSLILTTTAPVRLNRVVVQFTKHWM